MSINNKKQLRIITLVLLVILSNSGHVFANNLKEIVNLEGYWRFSIGDNPEWKNPDFNDSDWDKLYVPRTWEANGFKDYNGFAWYRTEFDLYTQITDEKVYLSLGLIDDADEVYINGHYLGGYGNMPPEVSTAFNIQRKYEIPLAYLSFTESNYIAVRVYDYYQDGGIVSGPLGVYKVANEPLLEVNLTGFWFFEPEDDEDLLEKKQKNQVKSKIFVPAYWEDYGYSNYDGRGAFSTQFKLPKHDSNKEYILVLGYIDDMDQVYLNGTKIGSVNELKRTEGSNLPYFKILRGYAIPHELLNKNDFNKLSVVVFDQGGGGGIYEGPVGIATKENFELLKQRYANRKSPWELILESFGF